MPAAKRKRTNVKAVDENVVADVPADVSVVDEPPKKAKLTYGSRCRYKHALIHELKSERVSAPRQSEIRHILKSELADIPILSHAEISRLGD